MQRLIAVDWGTSSLRAALLGKGGEVIEQRASAQGILNVPNGDFASVLIAACADWTPTRSDICLMSGMIGSRQGWREAPYAACPAGFADVAAHIAWLPDAPAHLRMGIVPGLSCEREGVPDVMRGEETQVFGALRLLGLQDADVVLPGTHSKWVRVRGGRVEGFQTFMTGEFYALLRQHSILSRTLPAEDGALHEAAFDAGLHQANAAGSLLASAFSVRALTLFERLPADQQTSYLSGLVIGEELRAMPPVAQDVVLIGAPELTRRYARALTQRGIQTHTLGHEATWQGLWAIAQTLSETS